PFFLGMADTREYHAATEALHKAVRATDIPSRLAPAVEAGAEHIVAQAGGRLDVVDGLVRTVTFKVFGDYFGIPDPPAGDLRVWGTRLFEFQFADPGDDPGLRAEVDQIAPALRRHLDDQIAERRRSGVVQDDVLGRCIAMQAMGEPGFSDV